MKRLVTALVGLLLFVPAMFLLAEQAFFWLCAAVFAWSVLEFVTLARHWAAEAPMRWLAVAVPVLSWWILFGGFESGSVLGEPSAALFALGLALSTGVALLVLLARTPVEQSLPALGALAFGLLYFAVPLVSVVKLRRIDPLLLLLGLGIIWVGDAAAYYVGSSFGRRKLAPVISPNKSWEGAAASLVAALVVAVVWGLWLLGRVDPALLAVAAVTSVAAQLGDLVESMIKRGARIKDSGHLLPGHGGMYDRLDAVLLGLPVLLAAWWLAGLELPVSG